MLVTIPLTFTSFTVVELVLDLATAGRSTEGATAGRVIVDIFNEDIASADFIGNVDSIAIVITF